MATATEDGAKTEAGKAAAKERVANQGKAHTPATRATPGKEAKSSSKRRILSPVEKVQKLERELKEAREAAEKVTEKKVSDLTEQWTKLVDQVNERVAKIRALEDQLVEQGAEVTPFSVAAPATAEPKG